MLISLRRIIRTGFKSFFRNISLSMATIFVMVMVVSLIGILFLFNLISNILISSVQEKVDISVYFKEEVLVEEALELKSTIAKIPQVKEIEYISKEEALEKFIERHKDDPVLMESLIEVGDNPFLASLSIRAWQASQYSQVIEFLESSPFKNLIKKVDYYQRKPVIDKVFLISSGINKGGIFFITILGLVAFLVAFNTIRIAINNASEEVSTMRLVGASNWFIRGPFLIQGIIAGLITTLIALLIVYGVCYGLDSGIKSLAPDISIFDLFLNNFWLILLVQLAFGVGLGIISSMIAIRRYLRI